MQSDNSPNGFTTAQQVIYRVGGALSAINALDDAEAEALEAASAAAAARRHDTTRGWKYVFADDSVIVVKRRIYGADRDQYAVGYRDCNCARARRHDGECAAGLGPRSEQPYAVLQITRDNWISAACPLKALGLSTLHDEIAARLRADRYQYPELIDAARVRQTDDLRWRWLVEFDKGGEWLPGLPRTWEGLAIDVWGTWWRGRWEREAHSDYSARRLRLSDAGKNSEQTVLIALTGKWTTADLAS